MADQPRWSRRDFLGMTAGSAIAIEAGLGQLLAEGTTESRRPLTHVLINEGHFRRRHPREVESLLNAAQAFAQEFDGEVIDVSSDPSPAAIKRRLVEVARIPRRLVLLGEEAGIPRFKARIPRLQLETDYFYGDLDGDGLAEVAVSRVLGSPQAMLRQMGPVAPVTAPHAVLFSDNNPRKNLEMNRFSGMLGRMGCTLEARDWGDPAMLAGADVIGLFGHGDPNGWYGGINWTICTVPTVPALPRQPVVFAGACSTATPGAPILRKFMEKGCRSYIGASSAAYGFTPAFLANELNMHLFDAFVAHPDWTVPELVGQARVHYNTNHKLADALLRLEKGESAKISIENLSTALQWNVFGDMRATFPQARPRSIFRRVALASGPRGLEPGQTVQVPFEIGAKDGVPMLYFRAEWDKDASEHLELEIIQNRTLVHKLNWHRLREFWAYTDTIVGGYWEKGRLHAFALVPLFHRPGANTAVIRLGQSAKKSIRIHPSSAVQVWIRRTPRRLAPAQITRRKGVNLLWLCRNDDLNPMRRALVAAERLQFDHHEDFGDKLAPYEFPNDPEHHFDLDCYDVIFIDDVANGYRTFPRGMGARIREFVRRGGGLIMAGGYESYSGEPAYDTWHGGYRSTPIAEALPVEIEEGDDRVKQKVKVGEIDARHPIASGLDWSTIPAVLGYNRVKARPEATVLARLEGGDPFLVVWQFGKGRAAAITTRSARDWGEEFKKWVYYPRFWGNVIGWVSGLPGAQPERFAPPA